MATIDVSRISDAARADPEFRIASRYWTGKVRFDIGQDAYLLEMQGGQVAGFDRVTGPPDDADLRISAPPDEWEKLLQPVPPPFYVFPNPMITKFVVEGDQEILSAYHPALRRLVEVMRTVQHGSAGMPPTTVARRSTAKYDSAVGRYIYLTIDGVEYRVYYEETGRGIPILLQHTAGSDGRQWRHFLEDADFQQHFRMIAYDLPYHGKSVPPASVPWWTQEYQLTKDRLMKTVVALSHALELDRPIYMGSSIGGHLAGDLALYYPLEFRAVIGLNGSLATPPQPGPDIRSRLFHPRIANDAKGSSMVAITAATAPEAFRRECGWAYSQGAPPVFAGDLYYYMVDHDLRESAEQIDTSKVAVYMLSGEYDRTSLPDGAPELVRRVKGARYLLMPGLGHFPMAEDPDGFKAAITPVLDEIRLASEGADTAAKPQPATAS